jgi:hypothetical protein
MTDKQPSGPHNHPEFDNLVLANFGTVARIRGQKGVSRPAGPADGAPLGGRDAPVDPAMQGA